MVTDVKKGRWQSPRHSLPQLDGPVRAPTAGRWQWAGARGHEGGGRRRQPEEAVLRYQGGKELAR